MHKISIKSGSVNYSMLPDCLNENRLIQQASPYIHSAFTISNQSKRVNHIHDFPVYILICPPYSLSKPATEAKSVSSFILSSPHRPPRGTRFETAESHSFLLAPHSKDGWRAQRNKRGICKNQKNFDIFSKTVVSRYLYSRGT